MKEAINTDSILKSNQSLDFQRKSIIWSICEVEQKPSYFCHQVKVGPNQSQTDQARTKVWLFS